MIEQKITDDYKQAMKNKEAVKAATLSFLRAQIKNSCIEQKTDKLDDPQVIAVIKKQVKQRQDSIDQFTQGGRNDLVEKEKKELEVLKSYLPPEMPKEELQKIIDETIKELGASSMKDMGRVMKAVVPKTAGQADGKMVSTLVKESLSKL